MTNEIQNETESMILTRSSPSHSSAAEASVDASTNGDSYLSMNDITNSSRKRRSSSFEDDDDDDLLNPEFDSLEDALWRQYKRQKHVDLVIICKGESWQVHKAILCAQSEAISAMFEHRAVREWYLSEHDPVTVEYLVQFLYTGLYGFKTNSEHFPTTLTDIDEDSLSPRDHARVYALAAEYSIARLRTHAFEQYEYSLRKSLQRALQNDDQNIALKKSLTMFLESIPAVYSIPSRAENFLRVEAFQFFLKSYELFQEVAKQCNQFRELRDKVILENAVFAADVALGLMARIDETPICKRCDEAEGK